MARILFKGSTHFAGADRTAILRAAEDLGYFGVQSGHTLLVGSQNPNTIDHGVKQGAERFCHTFPDRSAFIEVHRPDDGEAPFPAGAAPNLHIDRRVYGLPSNGPSGGDRNWVVAHVAALEASDVLVLIGGGSGTDLAGQVAMERRWPIIPIASFGGAARELYKVLSYELHRQPLLADKLHVLNGPWQDDSASIISELIEVVVTKSRPYSYFISYSHADAVAADRVELLLRRQNKAVLRDERELTPGAPLDRSLTTKIAMASTFVSLHSENYAGSDYCTGELAIAHELKTAGKKPTRLVAVRLDDTLLSPLLAASVHLKAVDRRALDAAVGELIASEPS